MEFELRDNGFRNRNGPVLLAFSVMYSKDHGIELEQIASDVLESTGGLALIRGQAESQ
jgi:hypothetical protein